MQESEPKVEERQLVKIHVKIVEYIEQ